MLLDVNGVCDWSVSLPEELPTQYTVQDVAVFSKGYLQDYPVFCEASAMAYWYWATQKTAL